MKVVLSEEEFTVLKIRLAGGMERRKKGDIMVDGFGRGVLPVKVSDFRAFIYILILIFYFLFFTCRSAGCKKTNPQLNQQTCVISFPVHERTFYGFYRCGFC